VSSGLDDEVDRKISREGREVRLEVQVVDEGGEGHGLAAKSRGKSTEHQQSRSKRSEGRYKKSGRG